MMLKRITKILNNVITLDQMVDLLEILPYHDSEGKHEETLWDMNSEHIEARVLHSFAYQNDLEWDHGSLMQECSACGGYGEIEYTPDEFITCTICGGEGKVEIDFEDIWENKEYEKLRDEIEGELYQGWLNAVDNTVETAFDNLGMKIEVVETRQKYEKGYWYERGYLITSEKSWKDTAQAIADCISGEGYFYYENAKELKDSYPYTSYKETVINHLHYVTVYPKVYGSRSISRIFDDNLESYLRYW